jgi:hypothetical protein
MDPASSIVFPLLPAASFMSSIYTFLGLPFPLFPSIIASSICLGFLSSAILTRCLYHLNFLLSVPSIRLSCLSCSLTVAFLHLSLLVFPNGLHKNFISAAVILFSFLRVLAQLSAA